MEIFVAAAAALLAGRDANETKLEIGRTFHPSTKPKKRVWNSSPHVTHVTRLFLPFFWPAPSARPSSLPPHQSTSPEEFSQPESPIMGQRLLPTHLGSRARRPDRRVATEYLALLAAKDGSVRATADACKLPSRQKAQDRLHPRCRPSPRQHALHHNGFFKLTMQKRLNVGLFAIMIAFTLPLPTVSASRQSRRIASRRSTRVSSSSCSTPSVLLWVSVPGRASSSPLSTFQQRTAQ